MQKVVLAFSICLVFGVITVSAQTDYCFQNNGLKLQQTVSFTLTKTKIEGTFESSSYEPTTSAETFDFKGTKTGKLLTIRFAGAKPPYELPPGTKRIVWTLSSKTLGIPTYGKNYNTGKYAPYTASYEKCKETP
jgi:hypothetical protein